jgi:hypothetical protein
MLDIASGGLAEFEFCQLDRIPEALPVTSYLTTQIDEALRFFADLCVYREIQTVEFFPLLTIPVSESEPSD